MARKSRKPGNVEVLDAALYVRTAQYIRLSVEDNKKNGNSIETQKQVLENYIAVNPEFVVHDVYIDNGLSGTNFERPAFKRMIADIEDGKIGCVITKDLSRLGRNIIDTGFYIERYFPSHNVRFIAVTDNYDSNDSGNSQAGVIMPLKNMINEAYAIEISKKVRAQAHRDMVNGRFIGARPPYGYVKAPDDCHKLIIDPEASVVVKRIFEWAADGVGLNTIVLRLNAEGVQPPNEYAQNKGIINHRNLRGQGNWQTRTISKIIAAEVYMGDMVQGKTQSTRRKQTRIEDKEQWIRVENTHEPIVSRELWETAQKERTAARDEHASKVIDPYSENIFKGKVFCASCGGALNRHRDNKRNVYYFHCLAKSRISKDACPGVMMLEDDLREAALTVLKEKAKIIIGENLRLNKDNAEIQALQSKLKSEKATLNDRLDKDRRLLRSSYESLKQGVITRKEYFEMRAGYDLKITTALGRLADCEKELAELNAKIAAYSDYADTLRDICENSDLDRALIIKLIDSIKVFSDHEIEMSYNWQNEFDDVYEKIGGVCNA